MRIHAFFLFSERIRALNSRKSTKKNSNIMLSIEKSQEDERKLTQIIANTVSESQKSLCRMIIIATFWQIV